MKSKEWKAFPMGRMRVSRGREGGGEEENGIGLGGEMRVSCEEKEGYGGLSLGVEDDGESKVEGGDGDRGRAEKRETGGRGGGGS